MLKMISGMVIENRASVDTFKNYDDMRNGVSVDFLRGYTYIQNLGKQASFHREMRKKIIWGMR